MNNTNQTFNAAKEVRKRAYAPYSNFKVGAALKLKNSETIIAGCNVENASYGGTICAERSAIFNTLSQTGKVDAEFLVLVTDPMATPCGFCLQVMAEFLPPEFPVHLANPEGIQTTRTLSELLPHSFDRRSLNATI